MSQSSALVKMRRDAVVPLALVGHHVAGRLEALHDVSHIVARHVETVLSAANHVDALAEGEDAKDDAPRELRGVCSRHAGGLGAARWAAARPGGRAASFWQKSLASRKSPKSLA